VRVASTCRRALGRRSRRPAAACGRIRRVGLSWGQSVWARISRPSGDYCSALACRLNLDRAVFDQALHAEVVHPAGGRRRATGAELHRLGSAWQVRLADGTAVEATFIVDATGRAAWVGRERERVLSFSTISSAVARLRPVSHERCDPPRGSRTRRLVVHSTARRRYPRPAWLTTPTYCPRASGQQRAWVRHIRRFESALVRSEGRAMLAVQVVLLEASCSIRPRAPDGWHWEMRPPPLIPFPLPASQVTLSQWRQPIS